MSVKGSRGYVSPLREEAARATRSAVLRAAHELFVERGYGATTVDEIAARAGVSKPTVFAAVGSKSTLLKQVRDVAIAGDERDVPVAQRMTAQEVLAGATGEEVLRRYARFAADINSRYAAVSEVLHQAAGSDAEMRALWQESERQRRAGADMVVREVARKGRLRHPRAASVDLLWSFTAPEHLARLVHDRGWSLRRFERWLGDTLCEQLLQ